ncbi:MAG: cation:proton antiporter subunit C [Clostridia bacterium]|nr:cation:proton antiporter subunit C [Clostridia bacterium]
MIDVIIAIAVIGVALYGIATSKNIIKTIICFNILQAAVILLFIVIAGTTGYDIPILTSENLVPVDPLPQALMITAIVISASVTALSLMFFVKIFHYYGTSNWETLISKDESQ